MRIIHIITTLNDGGAEAVLFRLCTNDFSNDHTVISLMNEGKYGPLLNKAGVAVHSLNMRRGWLSLSGVWRLAWLLRKLRPDVVQTWMYHADLVGGVVARVLGVRNVFWGLRHSNLESGKTKRATIMVAHLNAILSHWIPTRIISCSHKAVTVHAEIGYAPDKFIVVPNGYDLSQFAPDTQARNSFRSTQSLPSNISLLGMVARFDPLKDHLNLIAALGLLKQRGEKFLCALVGSKMTEANSELVAWIDEHNVRDRILLLGQSREIPSVMNALDVHVLSSASEAFPNVLCEAMACSTPCVTTNVGDAAMIVGDTGWVVPPSDPIALADGIQAALNAIHGSAWTEMKRRAHQRIEQNFRLERMCKAYNQIWSSQA